MTSQNLSKVIESMPDNGIDFEYCAVQQTEARTFMLTNPTNSLVQFEICTDDNSNSPFTLEPKNGMLRGGHKKEISIVFAPTEAKVVVCTAVFKFQEGDKTTQKVLKISGIGKFPFVNLSTEKMDFEQLTVGQSDTKTLELRNYSQVFAQFKVETINDDGKDQAFSLSKYSGTIKPGGSQKITVTYAPSIVGQYSCTHYTVQVKGGNELKLTAMGQANGIDVYLSNKSIHFGEVQQTGVTNRLLNIINESAQPTTYQFYSDKSNVFSFSKLEGIVAPHSQARIIIEFYPQQTQNYHERVFCVVRNHQVLYVDLIGTCYDILTKPMPLMQRHVDIHRHKVIMGVHNKPRRDKTGDPIDQMANANASFNEDRASEYENMSAMDLEINQEVPIDDPSQVVLHKEMFADISAPARDVRFSQDFLDFAFADSGRISESKSITLDNAFPFAIDVDWALLNVLNKTTGQWVKNPFRIKPEHTRIDAHGSANFTVDFAPYEPDQYFFQTAQCFIQVQNGGLSKNKRIIAQEAQKQAKANMTKSSMSKTKTLLGSMKKSKYEDAVNEDIDPPICMNVRLVGHSFPPGSQPFIPMVKLSPQNNVTFPSCGPNESVYQTIQISNTSDTPVYYKILQDSTKTFKAFPAVGLIHGKSFGIVCFEFNPRQAREFNFQAQCIYNHNPGNIQKINLVGHCYEPALKLSNDQKLFFPPIYKGVSSKQQLQVKNESRIPLQYEWKVPDKYKNEIRFAPTKAYLLPNEECKIVATFTALKKKDYHINVPIYARNVYDHVKNSVGFYNPGSGLQSMKGSNTKIAVQAPFYKKYNLEIFGRGSDGGIQIQPSNVDFGTITVGFNKTMQATVYNRSNCNIFIELKMAPKSEKQGGKSKYSNKELSTLTKVLNENFHFDTPKGIINAKSKKTISITFKPQLRFDFDINLVCVARERMDKDVQTNIMQNQNYVEQVVEKSFITVQAKGDYPLLRFEDVRNDQESIANLWERFNMTKMNKDLLNPLNESEKVFNNSDQTNQSLDDLIRNLTVFDWDFGKIPIKYGSKPRKVTLTIKNIGGVQAEWQFKLPNDSEIEMEPWADPGEPTPEKAFEKHILDNKIFNVQPRQGILEPGEQMELNVFYYPKETKRHHLKAFLQIMNGKPLIINFQGETLHRRAYLRLLKDTYYLPATPIGLEWAVTYPIEIKNLGITKLKYQIDTQALEALNENNYDFRIFEIQNPEGTLAANDTQYIYTLFRPLEAKEYSVDLPIKISDIEGPAPHSHVLKLRGVGYHPENESERLEEVKFYEDLPTCRAFVGEEGQMAAFSYESIDFGDLESNQVSNRFVILYNLHQTQTLKFDFQKSGLMCGDNLKLEPMSGELEPNSHQNIKMTLIPARFPTHFEGEIQCSIDWLNQGEEKAEMKSMHTSVVVNDQEFLFLRLRKRTKFTKDSNPIESRENETIFSNVMNEMMNDILFDAEMDALLDQCHDTSGGIFNQIVTSDADPPSTSKIYEDLPQPLDEELNVLHDQPCYVNNLKELTGNDDDDIKRKTCFMDKKFTDMLEYTLEDTIFNLMEEATFEEFDLMQAPKIYIRKDQVDKK